MPFKDLDRLCLRTFIEREQDESVLWLFMHIPKTAGSAFASAMGNVLHPYKNIGVDYNDTEKSHNEKIIEATELFILDHEANNYKSASGHITFDLVEKIRNKHAQMKLVTFLRNPVKRVISDYRYQRTPMHPPHKEFIKKFPVIEDFINHPPDQNKITKFICGKGNNASSSKAIERLDNDFSFVGLQEMYPFSHHVMLNLFGAKNLFPAERRRETPDTPDTKVEINDKIVRMIRDKNAEDISVFKHVQRRLLAHRDDWSSNRRML